MSIPEFGFPIEFDPSAALFALTFKSDQRLARVLAELSLGDEIAGQVIEAGEDGTILLNIRGESVQARSALDLRPGSVVNLRLISLAPDMTLQVIAAQPDELPLTLLASRALSAPGALPPLIGRLGALVEALRSLLSGEQSPMNEAITQDHPADAGGLPKALGQREFAAGAATSPEEVLVEHSSLPRALSSEPLARPDEPATSQPVAPQATPGAGATKDAPSAPPSTTAPPPLPDARASQRASFTRIQTTGQPSVSPSTDPKVSVAEAWDVLPPVPDAGRLIEGIEKALKASSLDLHRLTPEAVQKAIVSVGEPIEQKLLRLLDPSRGAAPSEVEADLKTALVRTLQSPHAEVLPDALKQLAAQAVGQLEARQALNVLAMPHGQLLFELALPAPGGWDLLEILVEEDGGREGSEPGDRGTQVTLQLSPDGLGPIRVLTRLSGDEVSCCLACADARVSEFVSTRLPELRSGLESQGLQVKALHAVVVPNSPGAFAPLRPSRLLSKPLLDARV